MFLEELHLSGGEEAGCPSDYLRFGRDDFLGSTTHRSPRFCGDKPRIDPGADRR